MASKSNYIKGMAVDKIKTHLIIHKVDKCDCDELKKYWK